MQTCEKKVVSASKCLNSFGSQALLGTCYLLGAYSAPQTL